MHLIDLIIVIAFMLVLLALGAFFSKRAGKDSGQFILAGRSLPWWLAGTSMVATNLNASTMLQDARKIRQDGIAGLWFTWTNIINSAIATVWFNRLWRRAEFTTQMEFYQARYAGKRAHFSRLFDTVLYGIIVGGMWAAVGLVGMKKVVTVLLDAPERFSFLGMSLPTDTTVVLGLVVVAISYSAASGLHGVVWTDMVEFGIAMIASIALTWIVYSQVGWNTGLREKVDGLGEQGDFLMSLLPTAGPIFIYFIIIHPLLSNGGYNPNVQRVLALKNEREVIYMDLYGKFINFVVKPFPYYICGIAGIFLFSDQYIIENLGSALTPSGEVIPDYERVYPALVKEYLPVGLTGVMIAGFMSAFMSSFDTNIHNATSTFSNDLYRGYLARNKSEEHYVFASRVFMIAQTIFASLIGILVEDILVLTMFALALPISAGLVKVLRFIWWRINGQSEIAAQLTSLITVPFILSPFGKDTLLSIMHGIGVEGNDGFFITRQLFLALASTVIAIAVALMTKPEPMDKLVSFYKRVRPYGYWAPVIEAAGEEFRNRESRSKLLILTICLFSVPFSALGVALALSFAMWTLLWPSCIALAIALWTTFYATRKLYPQG